MLAKDSHKGYNLRVTVSEKHDDGRAGDMAKTILGLIANDLTLLGLGVDSEVGVDFSVYLREYDLDDAEEVTWHAELATIPEINPKEQSPDGKKWPIITTSQQFYKAYHKLKPDLDYCGCFEVRVVMYGDTADNFMSSLKPDPLAKIIARLANAHYREQICVYYAEWDTDYVNAPDYISTQEE